MPTLAGRPCNFGVVDHAQTTTDKTGKLTIGFPCRGEIHGVDYCTFLICFVSSTMPLVNYTANRKTSPSVYHDTWCRLLHFLICFMSLTMPLVNYTANRKTSPSKWTEKKDYEGGESCIGWEETASETSTSLSLSAIVTELWSGPLKSRDLKHAIFAKSRDSFTRISHSTDVMTTTLLFYEMPVSQCMHSQARPSMLLASV